MVGSACISLWLRFAFDLPRGMVKLLLEIRNCAVKIWGSIGRNCFSSDEPRGFDYCLRHRHRQGYRQRHRQKHFRGRILISPLCRYLGQVSEVKNFVITLRVTKSGCSHQKTPQVIVFNDLKLFSQNERNRNLLSHTCRTGTQLVCGSTNLSPRAYNAATHFWPKCCPISNAKRC